LSTASNWIGVQTGVYGFDSVLHKTCGFKNIWSRHLVKQLWPHDGCRRTEGRLSTTLAAKWCMISTQKERSFKWIDPSKWWWREEWWTSRESLWHPSLIPVYQMNSFTLLLLGLRSSWNLVNPLLSINEAWMDECAATIPIENRKIPRFDRNNPIVCWGQKKKLFKKIL